MSINNGTRLNPSAYKTFIPDQYKTGAQKDTIGKSIQQNFFSDSKIAYSNDSESQPIRTLDFIRERILNNIELNS